MVFGHQLENFVRVDLLIAQQQAAFALRRGFRAEFLGRFHLAFGFLVFKKGPQTLGVADHEQNFLVSVGHVSIIKRMKNAHEGEASLAPKLACSAQSSSCAIGRQAEKAHFIVSENRFKSGFQ